MLDLELFTLHLYTPFFHPTLFASGLQLWQSVVWVCGGSCQLWLTERILSIYVVHINIEYILSTVAE